MTTEFERLQRAVLDAINVASVRRDGKTWLVEVPSNAWNRICAAARPGVEEAVAHER